MNCPKCNTALLPNAKFCGACGLTMQAQPPIQQTQPQGAFHFDADNRGQGRGYTWEILHAGAFALAVVNLQSEQSISAEAGAMVSMSGNVELQSEMKGGVFGALKRAVGGESAFVSTFTARGGAGEVTLAPGTPGDVVGIEMNRFANRYKIRRCKIVFRRRRNVFTQRFGNRFAARFIVRSNSSKDFASGRNVCG
jgi:hypothetical protein